MRFVQAIFQGYLYKIVKFNDILAYAAKSAANLDSFNLILTAARPD